MDNVENDRYISVFINEKGKEEYINGLDYNSPNVLRYSLSDVEFYNLIDLLFIQTVNERCKLLIGSGESEMVENENIEECSKIYKRLNIPVENSVMYEALKMAEKYGLGMGLDL